jgi:hypothetical protein
MVRLGCVILASSLIVAAAPSRAQDLVAKGPQGHPVTVVTTAFESRSGSDDIPFTRYDGGLFGLQQDNNFGPRDFFPPFFNGGGIASGDIDRDGWPDVVSASGPLIHI